MVAAQDLVRTTEDVHRTLSAELATAAEHPYLASEPRKGIEYADHFLSSASRHLNAVESVVVPAAQRHLPDGDELAHAYVRVSKDLETALVSAKGREYGSASAVGLSWPAVWAAVATALDRERQLEMALAERLTDALDTVTVTELVDRLRAGESDAPTRPHPHAPHLGARGRFARRVLHAVDSFWDTTEGRMVPEKDHPARKKPGLLAQYLLADPRFDEDE